MLDVKEVFAQRKPHKGLRDLTGETFGLLTVVGLAYLKGKKRELFWACDCACGTKSKSVRGAALKNGQIKSCGCLRDAFMASSKVVDIVGQRINRLVVVGLAYIHTSPSGGKTSYWNCVCDCGKTKVISQGSLRRGQKGCGECPNDFEHLSDGSTALFIKRKDGTVVRCFIDTADFEAVHQYRWFASPRKNTTYAKSTQAQYIHQLLCPSVYHVDHKDGDGLNNRRLNLRLATRSQNLQNRGRQSNNKTSRFKGVSKSFRKIGGFVAHICVNKKQINLGTYASEEDAAHVYDLAARKYFGEFARVNFKV